MTAYTFSIPNLPHAGLRRLAWAAAAFALLVIVFGAFVRLSNAGLSCPDWPTCYGHMTWPTQEHEVASANSAFPDRPVESGKAWREQVHRILVGGLSLLTFALAGWAWWRRRDLRGISVAPLAAAVVIVFQALLGMWTVTLKLLPAVVMAHLLGGLLLFALLGYTALRLTVAPAGTARTTLLRRLSVLALGLLALQIALGGWTSSNYAALACGNDFPKCLGFWWPPTDFREGFVLWRGIGANYEGGVLDTAARSAIQLTHRIGALLTFLAVGAVAAAAARRAATRAFGVIVGILLLLQIALGIGNVVLGLPLAVAIAHNGVAALLLLALLALLVRSRDEGRGTSAAGRSERVARN
ncbi:MAG TPA: COX15/CtaA family protein [Rhodanobacteraceae bacterium]|jgi:cytochrome c oxidase assembly protein subunit 15|nr:COX15/CtaA family protein [Rhodanobacteraceae bacterium]